jgi:hypothetical protein
MSKDEPIFLGKSTYRRVSVMPFLLSTKSTENELESVCQTQNKAKQNNLMAFLLAHI